MLLEVDVRKKLADFTLDATFVARSPKLGVFGPSGSGKSTLVRLLAGLEKPDDGTVRLNGEVLHSSVRSLPPDKRRVGVVFQDAHLFPHLTVEQNLLYGYKRLPREQRKIDPRELYEALNLTHLLGRGILNLSGGERRRTAMGRAVLACPRLILMDEPLTGLDQSLMYQIVPYLRTVFERFEIPVVFISHSVEEMRLMTESVLMVEEGRITDAVDAETLEHRALKKGGRKGYLNILTLKNRRQEDDLWSFEWGGQRLKVAEEGRGGDSVFTIEARDVILVRQHPGAVSARNLLEGVVTELFNAGNMVCVALDVNGERLVSQVVQPAVDELDIKVGSTINALIKATSFRQLY